MPHNRDYSMSITNFSHCSMSKNNFFIIVLSIFVISFSSTFYYGANDVFGKTNNINDNKNDENPEKFKLNVGINLINIKDQNPQIFKLIAFINGEIQSKIIDLKKNATISKDSKIITPFYFDTSNDISEINVGDEYFVCGYVLKNDDNNNTNQKSNGVNSSSNAQLMPYDCNEGGIVSTTKDSIGLFSTMNKFIESSSIYQARSKTSTLADINNKEVKITLLNPLDAKKIKDLDNVQFTAMVKGEYQIKKMNIKDEIKKSKIKDTLKVPFVFNSNTDIGPVQVGDYYFGCITANDYWSKEHSECEKRFIQHLNKSNDLPVAH
ncbi:MAG TPA: hypothetical protein VFC05_09075 [Nitrososphaeraceae archaeon]|nr:hypothetical protein [Nitrososphaeraceae archaeon]